MGSLVSSVADVFGLGPASIQARATRDAANTAAGAQLQAAQLAAEAQKFRPVGVTTRFGSSQFQMSPEGYLQSAGYTLSPELQAIQDYVMGQTRTGLGDTTSLLNLGRGYLAQTPEQAAADWMAKQQAVLAPSREQSWSNLSNQLFNTGRGGLSIAQGGGLQAANPEAAALANAQAMQDLQLAAQAQQAGQQQVAFGQGLLSSAYSPIQTGLGFGATIEGLGQSPLDIGAQLGGRSATAGANVGQSLLAGGLSAAKTLQPAMATSPLAAGLFGLGQSSLGSAADKALGNWVSSLWGGGNTLNSDEEALAYYMGR